MLFLTGDQKSAASIPLRAKWAALPAAVLEASDCIIHNKIDNYFRTIPVFFFLFTINYLVKNIGTLSITFANTFTSNLNDITIRALRENPPGPRPGIPVWKLGEESRRPGGFYGFPR